jgi:predicted PurR-regulated permease PerM
MAASGSDGGARAIPSVLDYVAPEQIEDSGPVPPLVQAMASWAWRLMLIGAFIGVLMWGLLRLGTILVPIALAILVSVLLSPVRDLLESRGLLGRKTATAVCVLGTMALLLGVIYLAGRQLFTGFTDLSVQVVAGVNTVRAWVAGPPLNLTNEQFDMAWRQVQTQITTGDIVNNVISGASGAVGTAGNIAYGIGITLFCTIFFLYDGRNIWAWLVNLLPIKSREKVHQASRRSMVTLRAYVQTQIVVAGVDAIGIGLGALFFVPRLALPIAVLVFLGGAIPILGAVVTGVIATLAVLMMRGLVPALVMLLIVLVVQQLESQVLSPLLLGHAVSLHPIAVTIAVAVGLMTAGIFGALLSVPLIAVANTFIQYLFGYDKFPQLGYEDHLPLLRKTKVEEQIKAVKETFRHVDRHRRDAVAEGSDVFLTDLGPGSAVATKAPKRESKRKQQLRKRGLVDDDGVES